MSRVPIVAVSKEPHVSDDPSQSSGARLQIPGARSSKGRSRKDLHSNVPSQENPGQALGDRLHLTGVQAPGDRSRDVPEWLQIFEEGLSGDLPPPDSHIVVGGTTCI